MTRVCSISYFVFLSSAFDFWQPELLHLIQNMSRHITGSYPIPNYTFEKQSQLHIQSCFVPDCYFATPAGCRGFEESPSTGTTKQACQDTA